MSNAKYFDASGRINNPNATTGFHLMMSGFEMPEAREGYPHHLLWKHDWALLGPLDAPETLPMGGTRKFLSSSKVVDDDVVEERWIISSLCPRC